MDLNEQMGFGEAQQAQELIKAMVAGQITGRDTANQSLTMEPMKLESLEKTLKILERRMQDIKLFNMMPKLNAYNTVEEFIQQESYGTQRGGFYDEGELSDVEDSKYKRRAELVKYLQVTGEVTLQAQMVRSIVPAMRQEVENKAKWIMKRANYAMAFGNSKNISQEWNGIYAQHALVGSGDEHIYSSLENYHNADVVYDLRGASLKQSDVEKAAIIVDDNEGNIDTLFAPPKVNSALSQDYFSDQRILQDGTAVNGVIGTVAKAIDTSVGKANLVSDKSLKKVSKLLTDGKTSAKAPSQVTPGGTPVALSGADALSKFSTAEGGLGTVFYAVSARNRYGESALSLLDANKITLTNGQSVDLSFARSANDNYLATSYVVYRSKVTSSTSPSADGVTFYPLFELSQSELGNGYDGAASNKARDRNRWLPDTDEAFITQNSEEVYSFKQLAPISKMDLALTSLSNRFITFLFGTPQLYAHKKIVRFINCGRTLSA